MPRATNRASSLIPMLIIGSLFFMFGFITWLNGSLIPFLQIACELDHLEAYLVTMAFYIAYTVMALPMSFILRRSGFKNGMVIGLLLMAVGSLIFIPAAQMRLFPIFLFALFVLGTGLTILQTASNPYIVLIGSRETAAVRISVMGILNKLAGVLAPIVFSAYILSDLGQFTEQQLAVLPAMEKALVLDELSARLVQPYLLMSGLLIFLAIFVYFSPLPNPEEEQLEEGSEEESILQKPQVILGAIALFFYVGAEVIAGDTIGLFGKSQGVENFAQLTAYTMSFMVVGYILGIVAIPRWISQQAALAIAASIGCVFTVLLVTATADSYSIWNVMFSWTGVTALPNAVLYVAMFGLCNAIVWPAIWPLALKDLGPKNTSTGSALLIMGISGGAIFPLLYSALASVTANDQASYLLMAPCYLFILFYAFKGHKIRVWRRSV